MEELVLRNAELGISIAKVNLNGTDYVWADDVRRFLVWDTMQHMLQYLKEGKEYVTERIKDLKSKGWNFTKLSGVKKNTLYAHFLTRQGVMRLIATRRPHDIKDNPMLAEQLDKFQDWVFGEVLPEAVEHGVYVSEGVATAPQEIRDKVILDAIDRAVDKRLSEAMPQLMRRQWQINNAKTATAMQTASVLSRENKKLRKENSEQRLEIERLKVFETKDIEHRRKISEGVRRHNAGLSKEDVKDTRQLELPLRNLRRR